MQVKCMFHFFSKFNLHELIIITKCKIRTLDAYWVAWLLLLWLYLDSKMEGGGHTHSLNWTHSLIGRQAQDTKIWTFWGVGRDLVATAGVMAVCQTSRVSRTWFEIPIEMKIKLSTQYDLQWYPIMNEGTTYKLALICPSATAPAQLDSWGQLLDDNKVITGNLLSN